MLFLNFLFLYANEFGSFLLFLLASLQPGRLPCLSAVRGERGSAERAGSDPVVYLTEENVTATLKVVTKGFDASSDGIRVKFAPDDRRQNNSFHSNVAENLNIQTFFSSIISNK